MARDFVRASSQYLETDTAPVTAVPFTLACWINPDDTANDQYVMFVGDKDVTGQYWSLRVNASVGGDPIQATASTGAGDAAAQSSTGITAGTWHHIAGVFTSATSRAAFIDGGSKGTNTANRAPTGADRITIGRRGTSSPGSYYDGRIAEAAVWDVDLSDDDVASLARGYSPLLIRPANLVGYWPIIGRSSPEIDPVGGLSLTVTGATVSPHPRIIYNPIPQFARKAAGGGGGGPAADQISPAIALLVGSGGFVGTVNV